ncbi:hypothetical protein IT575_08890 [bacterium]|nr:hypothetical protein [bacterium]
MDVLVLAMLALISGALVYLFNEQRKFQRNDPLDLIRQEDEERRQTLRLERLEDLLGRLVEQERRKREETAAALSEVRAAAFKLRQDLEELKAEGRQQQHSFQASLNTQPAPAPAAAFAAAAPALQHNEESDLDDWYLPQAGNSEPLPTHSLPEDGRAAAASNLIQQGLDEQSVARQLGLSSHAVAMISALRSLRTA